MNENERLIRRIEEAEPRLNDEDCRVLFYIKSQLTPERIEKRLELEAGGEQHLREVAKSRLRPYESEVTNAQES
jgi:hypothetical protein